MRRSLLRKAEAVLASLNQGEAISVTVQRNQPLHNQSYRGLSGAEDPAFQALKSITKSILLPALPNTLELVAQPTPPLQ